MTRDDLLNIDDRWEFEEKLLNISEKYLTDINMWDKELIQYYLKIADMCMEELKDGFNKHFCPIDDEDAMNE